MAFPVFGVTYLTVAQRLGKDTVFTTAEQTAIARWLQQAAAQVASELTMIGISASDITEAEPMYNQCQVYIEGYVVRLVAQAWTRQDPDLAKSQKQDLVEFRQTIRQQPVGLLGDKFNNEEHQGSFSGSPGRAARIRRKARKGQFFM